MVVKKKNIFLLGYIINRLSQLSKSFDIDFLALLCYKRVILIRRMGKFMAVCPECGATIELYEDMEAGELIECVNCGLEIEIISLDPLKLEIFEEEEK